MLCIELHQKYERKKKALLTKMYGSLLYMYLFRVKALFDFEV